MLRILTDFDGPIMDVSERYYQVYKFCLKKIGQVTVGGDPLRQMSKAEFWALKRSQVPERRIGELSGLNETQAAEFSKLRKDTVHTLPYFVYDQPVEGAIATLKRIQAEGIDMATMTMRRVRELDYAFDKYSLGQYFRESNRYCLNNDYVKTNDVADKTKLMARALQELPSASTTWMIGDTEADICAAKSNGIPVVAVLSGIRDRAQLTQQQPNAIVETIGEAFELILSQVAVARR
jgi:phosphoglycolate phosphatase-like HAD superfamily hydrolase